MDLRGGGATSNNAPQTILRYCNSSESVSSCSGDFLKHLHRRFFNPAFTMAEVLITLGIIGIVAAMTLPTVINNIRDKQFKSMFKKQYSVMSQALQMLYAEDQTPQEFSDWREMPYYVCRLGEYLNAIQSGLKCAEMAESGDYQNFEGHRNTKVSWHKNGEWYNRKKEPQFLNEGYMFMTYYLADGAWVNFNATRTIFVDVNGRQKPNTIGRDIFYFYLPPNSGNNLTFFNPNNGNLNVNGSSGAAYWATINRENYKEDCESGSGWGCSPVYILD